MKTNLKRRQGGAVAVMVAAGLVMIIGFLALVIDLGHLYLARTGLQNAADAAALSGAKELDGQLSGIDGAVLWAQKQTAQGNDNAVLRNRFFGSLGWEEVTLPESNIHFSDTPYTSVWKSVADARANPAGLLFIKVDMTSGSMGTWFARIWSIFNISTYGSAVAGRFVNNIAPVGLCALDPGPREKWVQYESGGAQYKVEYGYMRGVNYDFGEINKTLAGLGPGTELYLHPTANSMAGCISSQGSADFAAPFLCTGRSLITGGAGSVVYTNTGLASGKSIAALNTRFNQYGPPLDSTINRDICPSDQNIREYTPSPPLRVTDNWMSPAPQQASAYLLDDWLKGPAGATVVRNPQLNPESSVVSANVNAGGCGGNCNDNYGVLWSYARPESPSGNFSPSDWPALYPQGPSPVSSPAYAGTQSTAYSYGMTHQSDAKYFLAPTPAAPTLPQPRRLLNVVLVNCTTPPPSGGICQPMTVLGVGRFFLQRTASQSDGISAEFAGLISEEELSSNIRLYR